MPSPDAGLRASYAAQVAAVVRAEGARLLATLVRTTGDWALAEDAVQEAVEAALEAWPRSGVPDHPRSWLIVAARRKAVDMVRRERARGGKEREGAELMNLLAGVPDDASDQAIDDDQLRLIFTCCHPALALDAQVALALRVLCQLPVPQIAAVLLTSEAAMAKRLTRTRTKIATANIPYRVPDETELPARLTAVCAVIHALYTAGHAPAGGDALAQVDVCAEGIRLARLVCRLMPDEATPQALLALLLFTESRRYARLGDDGEVVTLADQDRRRWDLGLIVEADRLLAGSLRRTDAIADTYQLQAAIAAQHALAVTYAETDWAEVVRLYDLLLSIGANPAAGLARAVAVAERDGADSGLAALAIVPPSQRWHAVRAELLARSGRYAEAVEALDRSLTDEVTAPERRHRERQRADWADLAQRDPDRSP